MRSNTHMHLEAYVGADRLLLCEEIYFCNETNLSD